MKKKYIAPIGILIKTEEELLITTVSFPGGPTTEEESEDESIGEKEFEGEAKRATDGGNVFFDDSSSDW